MTKTSPWSVRPLRVEEISDVRSTVEAWTDGQGDRALVLHFTGTFRVGSAGKPDATCMVGQVAAALAAWPCDAVVYDLSALNYRWGDGMIRVFAVPAPDAWLPPARAVVAGPASREGLQTLCAPGTLHDTVEAAVHAALAEARVQRATADALEPEPLVVVLSDQLSSDRAAEVIAIATAQALDVARGAWPLAAWLSGLQRVQVRTGTAEELAWARQQDHAWPYDDEAVVLAPRLP